MVFASLGEVPPQLWLILALLVIFGFANAMFQTSIMVWMQQILPLPVRGRVMTFRSILMGLAGVIGCYGMGALAARTNLSVGFITMAAILVASASLFVVPGLFSASTETSAPTRSV
jgi:hypothetical protein